MKQYITFEKEAIEKVLSSIRSRMYFLDSEIRILEDYGNGNRITQRTEDDYWKREAKFISRDMRQNFDSIAESMERFGFNINFDFEKLHSERLEKERKVLVEKIKK